MGLPSSSLSFLRATGKRSLDAMLRHRDVGPSDIELRAIEEDAQDKTRLLPTEDSGLDQLCSKSSFYKCIPSQAKWRSSVLLGAAITSIILIINLCFTI